MTQISETDLAEGSTDLWFHWLRAGLIAYHAKGSVQARYQAFAPLLVDPQSATPAGDIVEQIRSVRVNELGVAEGAAIEALRSWSLAADGWAPAALLISVAARLGGRGLADAILGLVARSGDLPEDARAELAYVAVQAALLRYKYDQIVSLARLLWGEEIISPTLIAELAVLVSRKDHGGLREMPQRLATMLPGLLTPPHTGIHSTAIADALRRRLGPEDIVRGLSPIEGEDDAVAEFRGVLFRRAAPTVANKILPFRLPTSDRVAARLSAMDEILGLPFPGPLGDRGDEGVES